MASRLVQKRAGTPDRGDSGVIMYLVSCQITPVAFIGHSRELRVDERDMK